MTTNKHQCEEEYFSYKLENILYKLIRLVELEIKIADMDASVLLLSYSSTNQQGVLQLAINNAKRAKHYRDLRDWLIEWWDR